MNPTDITIEILKGIRDEVKQTNTRIDSLHDEAKETNTRLESLRDEVSHRMKDLSQRIVASEVRTATAVADLSYTVREMTDVLRTQHDLRPRVDRCEHDITALKQRVGME